MDLIPKAVLNEPTGFRTEVEHQVRWMQDGHSPPLGSERVQRVQRAQALSGHIK